MLKRLGAQVVLTEPQPLKDPNTGFFSPFSLLFFYKKGVGKKEKKLFFLLTPFFF